MPLTESIAEAAPFGSSLADHQEPPRSASVNAAGNESDFQVISPARLSIWISSIACPSWEESARCGGMAKDFARSVFASEAKRISRTPSELMDRILGKAMQPAQPEALNSAWGRVSGIQPQRMRLPLASSCVFCA